MEEKEFVFDTYDWFKDYLEKDTSYNVGNEQYLSIFNQPNRENRRKELKKKTGNPHELNVGRISLSGNDIICLQKEKKKNFNKFIKGKVK